MWEIAARHVFALHVKSQGRVQYRCFVKTSVGGIQVHGSVDQVCSREFITFRARELEGHWRQDGAQFGGANTRVLRSTRDFKCFTICLTINIVTRVGPQWNLFLGGVWSLEENYGAAHGYPTTQRLGRPRLASRFGTVRIKEFIRFFRMHAQNE